MVTKHGGAFFTRGGVGVWIRPYPPASLKRPKADSNWQHMKTSSLPSVENTLKKAIDQQELTISEERLRAKSKTHTVGVTSSYMS